MFKNIAEWIKFNRTKNQITQEYLAQILETTQSVINKWENGKVEVPNYMLIELANVFNVPGNEPFNILYKQYSSKWLDRDIEITNEIKEKIEKIIERCNKEYIEFKKLIFKEFKNNVNEYLVLTNKISEITNFKNKNVILEEICKYIAYPTKAKFNTIVNEHTIYTASINLINNKNFENGFFWTQILNIKGKNIENYITLKDTENLNLPAFIYEHLLKYQNIENIIDSEIEKYINLNIYKKDIKTSLFCIWNFYNKDIINFKTFENYLDFILNLNNIFIYLIETLHFDNSTIEKLNNISETEYFQNLNIKQENIEKISENLLNIKNNKNLLLSLYNLNRLRHINESNQILDDITRF